MPATIDVRGMPCDGCEENVEAAIRAVPSVSDVVADRESDIATIGGDPNLDDVASAVDAAGYEASASKRA